jgi:hypothetical protein
MHFKKTVLMALEHILAPKALPGRGRFGDIRSDSVGFYGNSDWIPVEIYLWQGSLKVLLWLMTVLLGWL